jgi:hypothetical protein
LHDTACLKDREKEMKSAGIRAHCIRFARFGVCSAKANCRVRVADFLLAEEVRTYFRGFHLVEIKCSKIDRINAGRNHIRTHSITTAIPHDSVSLVAGLPRLAPAAVSSIVQNVSEWFKYRCFKNEK